jgi:hypothetical protein
MASLRTSARYGGSLRSLAGVSFFSLWRRRIELRIGVAALE